MPKVYMKWTKTKRDFAKKSNMLTNLWTVLPSFPLKTSSDPETNADGILFPFLPYTRLASGKGIGKAIGQSLFCSKIGGIVWGY
ncbi:hypothetical protein [Lihuaxuella thermophila]|uniref:hypothetical protein n=1 Tax=Lihuaxuella thermophila TaxID=1173111 RepID=UPI0011137777